MEELSFKCGGILVLPVKNKSENFKLDCEIRYGMSGQALITDSSKCNGETELKKYMQENMPQILEEAVQMVWGDAIPVTAFSGPWKRLEDAICKASEMPLQKLYLKPASVTVQALWIKAEDMETLNKHEDPDVTARQLKDFDIGPIFIDEGYKPWLFNDVAPTPAPTASGPWKCSACGMENITGKFCPQCGSPHKA